MAGDGLFGCRSGDCLVAEVCLAGDRPAGDRLAGERLTGERLTGERLPGERLPGERRLYPLVDGCASSYRGGGDDGRGLDHS